MTRLYTISPTEPATVVHFDWLTVVFPVPETEGLRNGKTVSEYVNYILADYGLDDRSLYYERVEHGIYSYENAGATANNSIIVGWHDDDVVKRSEKNANFMIQMSGSGVETFESILDKENMTVADFIRNVSLHGATFSRVDACNNFFNYGKKYSAKYVDEQASKGNLVTRASSIRRVVKYSSMGEDTSLQSYVGPNIGYTTYIGKNPKQLRVYNKLAERSDKVNLLYQVESWSRWEFQLNGVQAQGFIDNYLSRDCDLVQTWVDWLYTNYRFITRRGRGITKQSVRSRYPDANWYKEIIKTAKNKTIVRTEKQKPTFEKQAKWLHKQVYATLSTIYYARVEKYKENGILESDAKKLALEKVKADIEEQALLQNIDWTKVSAYVKEMGN